jgi:hypothetical protein
MARDEAAPEAAGAAALPDAPESEPASQDSQAAAPGAPAEVVASFESSEAEASSLRRAAASNKENAPVLESAARARPAAPASPGAALEDCDALRRSIDALGSEEASDARYGLALCSLERFDHESTEEIRTLAIEDAEAFLAGESEGSRAEEIRGKLRRIKPD